MNIGNRNDYIKYRFQKAEEAFQDAELLAKSQRWNATINRLYYACFYAVTALLLKNNITTHTHDGSRTQFSLHFIKNGLLPIKFGKHFSKLFDMRQKGDYGDLYDYDKESTLPLIKDTREFLEEIQKLITN